MNARGCVSELTITIYKLASPPIHEVDPLQRTLAHNSVGFINMNFTLNFTFSLLFFMKGILSVSKLLIIDSLKQPKQQQQQQKQQQQQQQQFYKRSVSKKLVYFEDKKIKFFFRKHGFVHGYEDS